MLVFKYEEVELREIQKSPKLNGNIKIEGLDKFWHYYNQDLNQLPWKNMTTVKKDGYSKQIFNLH